VYKYCEGKLEIYYVNYNCLFCLKNVPFALWTSKLLNIASLTLKSRFLNKVIFNRHEVTWSSQNQTEKLLNIILMVEPVFVAINLDEFWFGMKG